MKNTDVSVGTRNLSCLVKLLEFWILECSTVLPYSVKQCMLHLGFNNSVQYTQTTVHVLQ